MTVDLDELYRRASTLDPSRPSEAVRRKILEHAAAAAASTHKPANRARWRPAVFGTLAAAALAGLMVIPRVFSPHPVAESQVQSTAHAPPIAGNRPDTGPSADARPSNALPSPAPLPQAAARSRAIASAEPGAGAPSRKNAAPLADAVRSGAAAENVASFGHPASPVPDPSAALRRAAQTGDVTQLRALLGTQVPVDAPDERGQTALMLAASQGQIASVDVLLAHGADPNAANADGTTPLQAALAADQPAIVAALRRAGAR